MSKRPWAAAVLAAPMPAARRLPAPVLAVPVLAAPRLAAPVLAAVLSLALAGCSMFGTDTTVAPPVAGAPVPLVRYDGSYQGRALLVGTPGTGCPAGEYGVIEIGDHTLNFAYQPTVVFVAPVADDGTIHDTAGPANLDGQIVDGMLSLTVKTPECETHYAARIVWNHS